MCKEGGERGSYVFVFVSVLFYSLKYQTIRKSIDSLKQLHLYVGNHRVSENPASVNPVTGVYKYSNAQGGKGVGYGGKGVNVTKASVSR